MFQLLELYTSKLSNSRDERLVVVSRISSLMRKTVTEGDCAHDAGSLGYWWLLGKCIEVAGSDTVFGRETSLHMTVYRVRNVVYAYVSILREDCVPGNLRCCRSCGATRRDGEPELP